jgi:small subunit ribosomal protein S2
MKDISLQDLFDAGCHFGHRKTRWNPKVTPYLYGEKENVHIFDLVKTKKALEEGATFAKATAAEGGQIIFVGTKRPAQPIVREAAEKIGTPYVANRWLGGTITNWEVIGQKIKKLQELKENRGQDKSLTKKENLLIDREIRKLEEDIGGLVSLTDVPAAIFVVDAKKEELAVREANRRGVKVIAMVDTDSNPDGVDYVIPANDDGTKSIELIVNVIAEAVGEGKRNQKLKIKNEKHKLKT